MLPSDPRRDSPIQRIMRASWIESPTAVARSIRALLVERLEARVISKADPPPAGNDPMWAWNLVQRHAQPLPDDDEDQVGGGWVAETVVAANSRAERRAKSRPGKDGWAPGYEDLTERQIDWYAQHLRGLTAYRLAKAETGDRPVPVLKLRGVETPALLARDRATQIRRALKRVAALAMLERRR